MARAGPYPGTQAIRRAVALLKAFTDERPERSLADLAAAVGLNRTTAYRALAALEGEGLVRRSGGGDLYRLGPAAIVLGARAVRSSDLRAVARPALDALMRAAGETATLEVLVEGEVMILDEAKASGFVGARAEVGTRWPLHATSTGKALLAALYARDGDAGLAAAGLRDVLEACTPRTVTSPDRLRAELRRVVARGFAGAYEELQPGYAAVAAVVRDHEARPVGAISLGGPTGRITRRRMLDLGGLVRSHAAAVSAALGAPDGGGAAAAGAGALRATRPAGGSGPVRRPASHRRARPGSRRPGSS
jgi:IclR family acetate operon transcriptional repressor